MDVNGPGALDDDPSVNGTGAPPPASARERLLDAMARTVAEQGYAATSVADVLSAARVSRRTFYERFTDKQDCFLSAYDTFVARCLERVRAACHRAPTPEAAIARGVQTLLRALAAKPAFAHLVVVDILAAGPVGIARRDATLREFVGLVDATRATLPEPPAPPPDVVGHAIVGGIYELIYAHIVRGETARLPELADEMRHFARMLLGATPMR